MVWCRRRPGLYSSERLKNSQARDGTLPFAMHGRQPPIQNRSVGGTQPRLEYPGAGSSPLAQLFRGHRLGQSRAWSRTERRLTLSLRLSAAAINCAALMEVLCALTRELPKKSRGLGWRSCGGCARLFENALHAMRSVRSSRLEHLRELQSACSARSGRVYRPARNGVRLTSRYRRPAPGRRGDDHEFIVFGLRIRLIFGEPVPEWVQTLCVHRSAQKLVILAPQQELMNWLGRGLAAAQPIGRDQNPKLRSKRPLEQRATEPAVNILAAPTRDPTTHWARASKKPLRESQTEIYDWH